MKSESQLEIATDNRIIICVEMVYLITHLKSMLKKSVIHLLIK
jgi:hypothetical protein